MKKTKKRSASSGFTLMELLVVIFIIGILVSLALVSQSGAQKQARDTERRSDLSQYRNSLEAYSASSDGLYPDTTGAETSLSGSFCTTNLVDRNLIASCPSDPLGTGSYAYYICSSSSEYVVYGLLETGGANNYWVACSTGQSGHYVNDGGPDSETCPL